MLKVKQNFSKIYRKPATFRICIGLLVV